MTPKIYVSAFKSGPEATDKQQLHFETDILFAFENGYEVIQDANGLTFEIYSPTYIVECDLEKLTKKYEDIAKELLEDVDSDVECTNCANIYAIDQIINNTLSQAENITPQQTDTMLKLAQLRLMLGTKLKACKSKKPKPKK
jgi:DNA-directed RNA polymerase alpha subunit